MAKMFSVPGIGTFIAETKKGVTVIRDEEGEAYLTCAGFPEAHVEQLVAIVHHERERWTAHGKRLGRREITDQIESVVGLFARAWFAEQAVGRD